MLLEKIRDEISASGPMPFDRFMEIALYDSDGGFFTAGRLRSDRQGDFLTSPEVSPLFGETMGRFADAERRRVGDPFVAVDCGAGSGSLLRPLLDHLGVGVPGFAVEVSPAARHRLAALEGVTVVGDLAEVPGNPIRGVIVANELLDNLPAAVVVRRDSTWRELSVGAVSGGLALVEVEPRVEVAAWADRHAGRVADGDRVEVQLLAGAWLGSALDSLEAGAVVVVDYGDTADGLRRRRADGTVRTYREHHLGPDPLLDPGATDITLDVDFSALVRVAEEAGARVEYSTQAAFLETWGLRDRLETLRRDELAAARAGDTMRRLELRSRVTEAETLLHPRGLGDFRVLVARR